ncbi:MAG TPA: gephyrin-like molybdotransferase Glp [Acidimicrobiales bacterium]|nr:gephyrin-like molybdotransferase Glp [Acidimicrobiales bacterium]
MSDLIPLADAQRLVLDRCEPLAPRAVPLNEALGCVLAEAVTARTSVPPFANSAMDGYAVIAADTQRAPVTLDVLETIAAGAQPTKRVEAGQASRIMTGAPVPDGADAIVMVELTEGSPTSATVTVKEAVPIGNHIRHVGEDVAAGDEVFDAGTVLTPGHLGVLASLGVDAPVARPRARVGVISTGDELLNGSIHDSNRPALLAACTRAGFDAVDLGIVGDDGDALTKAIDHGAATTDVLLTTGGVSAGDFDYVKRILDTQLQVAIRPAKPLAFGVVDGTPVFGLPGNPVSSMVSFELFARPAIRKLMGFAADQLHRQRYTAVADEAMKRHPDGKTHFVRVAAHYDDGDGRWHVKPAGGQGSHQLLALARADALAILPDGPGVQLGERVTVVLL